MRYCYFSIASALALLSTLFRKVEAQTNVCFMLYQMADNDLEFFLRQDNFELTQSTAVRLQSLTTWIYFDGRNYRGDFEDITEPLAEVYNADGSPITVKETGSRYMTWNHTLQKMVVERTLPGEVNGDDPEVVYDFVTTALQDCVRRGTTEYIIVFSSHGGGFDGFGGDENPGRRRKLIQSNSDLVAALTQALTDTPRAPTQFDVLGFDACLMQAFGALDDYRSVAKYVLASESIVPGHGWAYDYFDTADSALDIAKNFQQNFILQMQGLYHESPKTMSIVDTQLFTTFLQAWEALSAEFTALLGNDLDFIVNLRRARASSLAFESVVDFPGTSTPSAVDIGDFLFQFEALCIPTSGSQLSALLANAQTAYDSMFVVNGLGPFTPPATGMHITWPLLTLYQEDPVYFEPLFDTNSSSTTTAAPNFLEFLWNYFNADTPAFTVSNSVCTAIPCGSLEPEFEGQLLLDPLLIPSGTYSTVISQITCTTDQVSVEFGIDLTASGSQRRHRLLDSFKTIKPLQGQPQEDKFVFYGGNVRGIYDPPSFSATWDGKFFLIAYDSGTKIDFAYVENYGDGSRKVPVVYWPSRRPVNSTDIPTGTFYEEAIALGGVSGYLYFTIDETIKTVSNLALYTESADFGTLSQTPLEAGGFISPIVFAGLNGVTQPFVGGFFETVIPWNTANALNFVTANAETVAGLFKVPTIILDMIAYDYDILDPSSGAGVDYASFAIDFGSSGNGTTSVGVPTSEPSASIITFPEPSSTPLGTDVTDTPSRTPFTAPSNLPPSNTTAPVSEGPGASSFVPSGLPLNATPGVETVAPANNEPSVAPAAVSTNASSASDSTTAAPTFLPSAEVTADCVAHDRCAARNLTGLCCDTVDGWTLDCCGPTGSANAQCDLNPVCANLTLTGQCCPTTDEKWLDCCQAVPDECQGRGACEMYNSTVYLLEVNSAMGTSSTGFQDCSWSALIVASLLGVLVR